MIDGRLLSISVCGFTLICALACGGSAPDPIVEAPAPTPVEPAPEAPVAIPKADCSGVILVEDPDKGEKVRLCTYQERDFEQMCAGDPSGCSDEGESCRAGCLTSQCDCEDACTATCEACDRVGCEEDFDTCVAGCGEVRETCMTACDGVQGTCELAFETKVAQACPACDERRECLEQRSTDCDERFPMPEFCEQPCRPEL